MTSIFSIVIPTRNRPETVKKTIDSVLNQDFDDIELIIADNSTNSNADLEQWLLEQKNLPKKLYYYRTGGSLEMDANWETASRKASGAYLLMLPDRWVMRGGTLRFLMEVISSTNPECVFWDTKLGIDGDERIRQEIKIYESIDCKILRSTAVLQHILNFEGYTDDTVFTQPFPRALNSLIKRDVSELIRDKFGKLFIPCSCDYTSGIGVLLNTKQLVHIQDSLYIPIGEQSNGQTVAVFGMPERLKHYSVWRGLQLDSVFLSVVRDIEHMLEIHGKRDFIKYINNTNLLLSLLNEIHFKEWHGSPLDIRHMRGLLIDFAGKNFGQEVVDRLRDYDRNHVPRMRNLRRHLQKLRIFYPLYKFKHRIKDIFRAQSSNSYKDDTLSGRNIRLSTAGELR
jgi:glycosyltransferase involved in cell wall biosynthesis